MLIFQSDNLNSRFSANLPTTHREPTGDLPLTTPPFQGVFLARLRPPEITPAETVQNEPDIFQ